MNLEKDTSNSHENSDVNKKTNKKKKKTNASMVESVKESSCLEMSDKDENEPKIEKTKKSKVVNGTKSRPTLSETGFLWDIKPEDLNKPQEEIKDDSDEVCF